MIVIVEGCKYSGKSTLCNKLAAKFGGEIIHFPTTSEIGTKAMSMLSRKLTEKEYIQCQDLMQQDIDEKLATLDPEKLYILDRSFISNAVYRSSSVDPKYENILNQAMVIILLPNPDVVEYRIETRTAKTMTEMEKIKLFTSMKQFALMSAKLGCSEITEIKKIEPGKWYIINQ